MVLSQRLGEGHCEMLSPHMTRLLCSQTHYGCGYVTSQVIYKIKPARPNDTPEGRGLGVIKGDLLRGVL